MEVEKIMKTIQKKDYCKIVVGGDGAVGKTTLCQRISGTLQKEEDRLMTCGVEFHDLRMKKDKTFEAQIWDLGGQEHFRFMQGSFYKKVDIAIFVYSVEWYHSFVNVDFWLGFLEKEKPIEVYLIANKSDSEDRDVLTDEGREYAHARDMKYFEISALTGEGFNELKESIISTIESNFNCK